MRDAVGEVDGAVNWIHDPAVFGFVSPATPSSPSTASSRKSRVEGFFNQFLGADVEFEFDVVLGDKLARLPGVTGCLAHQGPDHTDGLNGGALRLFQRQLFHGST